jgi:hypothetical protein
MGRPRPLPLSADLAKARAAPPHLPGFRPQRHFSIRHHLRRIHTLPNNRSLSPERRNFLHMLQSGQRGWVCLRTRIPPAAEHAHARFVESPPLLALLQVNGRSSINTSISRDGHLRATRVVDKSVHSIAAPCVFGRGTLLVVIETAQTQPCVRVQACGASTREIMGHLSAVAPA